MQVIHLISGECGEYDSYHVWNVRTFADESAAAAFADSLNKIVAQHKADMLGKKRRYKKDDYTRMSNCQKALIAAGDDDAPSSEWPEYYVSPVPFQPTLPAITT